MGSAPHPASLIQRARAFAAVLSGSASLVTVRGERGLSHFVGLADVEDADQAAVHLAQSVAGRVDEVDSMPMLSTPVVGYSVAFASSVAVRDSQVGADPAELVRRLAVAMRPGTWVGVSCRAPKRSERRRVRRWYEHRLSTQLPVHHSSDEHPLVVSVWAGGESVHGVESLLKLAPAAMPGFDVESTQKILSSRLPRFLTSVVSLALLAGLIMLPAPWFVSAGVGAAAFFVVRAAVMDLLPTRARRCRALLADGQIPAPRRRRFPPSSPKDARSLANGRERSGSDGSYPLSSTAFLVGPAVVVGVVAPHAGAASGTSATDTRSAPAELLERIGPAVGTVGDTTDVVHVDAASMWSGVSLLGLPGSGKSALLRSFYAWHCLERVAPTGKPGWPGASNALVVFESKGDGAKEYVNWVNKMGDRTALVEVADPNSWAIDMFATPGTPQERATFFVNSMVYAFGSDSIGDRSYESLVAAFTAALMIDDPVAMAAGVGAGRSPVWLAHVLLGGQGDELAVKLSVKFSRAAAENARCGDVEQAAAMAEGVTKLAPMFGERVTPWQRRQLCEAPRNKLVQLLGVESWWSPGRPKFTWDRVLSEHRSVVINTGVTINEMIVDERLTAHLSSMIMYSLREAIMRNCSGWQNAKRSVTVFADELSLVAGSSPEVVTWMRNQGRAYGLRPIFATQYPEQLPHDVRTAFLSFGTTFWFAQNNSQIAAAAAADLSLSGEEWSPSEIAGLEKHVAILRATVDKRRLPPVPVRVTYWEGNISMYAAEQGWTI